MAIFLEVKGIESLPEIRHDMVDDPAFLETLRALDDVGCEVRMINEGMPSMLGTLNMPDIVVSKFNKRTFRLGIRTASSYNPPFPMDDHVGCATYVVETSARATGPVSIEAYWDTSVLATEWTAIPREGLGGGLANTAALFAYAMFARGAQDICDMSQSPMWPHATPQSVALTTLRRR